jgi:hypothetical protein
MGVRFGERGVVGGIDETAAFSLKKPPSGH